MDMTCTSMVKYHQTTARELSCQHRQGGLNDATAQAQDQVQGGLLGLKEKDGTENGIDY